MKEAFYNYAGSIRHTKLPVQYKIGFCRNCHMRLTASKSLRVATGVIVLSILSDVKERLTVMVHQKDGISTSYYSIYVVLQKLKEVLLKQLEVWIRQIFVWGVCVVSNPRGGGVCVCSIYAFMKQCQ